MSPTPEPAHVSRRTTLLGKVPGLGFVFQSPVFSPESSETRQEKRRNSNLCNPPVNEALGKWGAALSPLRLGSCPDKGLSSRTAQALSSHTLSTESLLLFLCFGFLSQLLFPQKSNYTTKGTTPPPPQHTPWAFPVRQRDPLALQSIPPSSNQ